MNLLHFMEILVADFGLWPSSVLSGLFLDLPSERTVRKVASFLYGNGVPLKIATKLCALCNPLWNDRASTDMNVLYHLWHAGVDERHHTKYYSTRHRQMYWIHGGDCARDEPVTPKQGIDIDEVGWEATLYGEHILDRLNDLKHEELTFDLIP